MPEKATVQISIPATAILNNHETLRATICGAIWLYMDLTLGCKPPNLIYVFLNSLHQGCLWHGTDHCVHLWSILEEHDCRDTSDSILRCYSRALISIQLELQENADQA